MLLPPPGARPLLLRLRFVLQSAGHYPRHANAAGRRPARVRGRGAWSPLWSGRVPLVHPAGQCSQCTSLSPPPGLCFWRRNPGAQEPERVFRPGPTPAPTQTCPASLAPHCPEGGGSSASRMREAWEPRRLEGNLIWDAVRAPSVWVADPWKPGEYRTGHQHMPNDGRVTPCAHEYPRRLYTALCEYS